MIKFGYYLDNVKDKAWFNSSNVIYGECDESDTQEKTVRLVFKNGTVYQYEKVNVYDWTLFKNSDSQGKALREIFIENEYPYSRLKDKMDINALNEEYEFRAIHKGLTIMVDDNNHATVMDNEDKPLYECDEGKERVSVMEGLLKALGHQVKIIYQNGEE